MSKTVIPSSACIFGFAGPVLSKEELAFFKEVNPFGYIIFERNIVSFDQLRSLTNSLRNINQSSSIPILVDQEGGRVSRLNSPEWRLAPPPARFGEIYLSDPDLACKAVRLNARLTAHDLFALGINVNCSPVLDLRFPGGHSVIGDRAFSGNPETVAEIAGHYSSGLLDGGVLPVLKHIPGHGRAVTDSHLELPNVNCSRGDLERTDFVPFRNLCDQPIAMTAHVRYGQLDEDLPASISTFVINEIIRKHIGFEGLLVSDDISSNMKALPGDEVVRALACLNAGCDLVLHCSGDLTSMRKICEVLPKISECCSKRWGDAQAVLKPPSEPFNYESALSLFTTLMN